MNSSVPVWTVAGLLVILALIGGNAATTNAAQLRVFCGQLAALNPNPAEIPNSAKEDCLSAGVPLN